MTIIKRTRLKFVMVMAGIIFAVVSAFCTSILVSTHTSTNARIDSTLENLIEDFTNMSLHPEPPFNPNNDRPSARFNELRGFVVLLNSDGAIGNTRYNQSIFTQEEIIYYTNQIVDSKKMSGEINNLRFSVQNVLDGKILAGIDTSVENAMFKQLLITVILVGGGGLLIILILAWFLSYWIVLPASEAIKKQKRFISDAGHELKTPITVISASIDLLQKKSESAENIKRLAIIKEQVEKMSSMTTELLTLSKVNEAQIKIKAEFNISQVILTEALAFEALAFENGKEFLCEIDGGISYKGDTTAVRQAIGILCDNAIKYSSENGVISIRLKKQGSKTILAVSNTVIGLRSTEIPLLFERFYRGEEARAESSGSGLGLSILKTLAAHNDWRLGVEIVENNIIFSIIFS